MNLEEKQQPNSEVSDRVATSHSAPKFKAGDVVRWINDNGVHWPGRRIISMDEPDKWGHRYYVEPTDCPWMYVREKNLSYETLSLVELQAEVLYDSSLKRKLAVDPNYLSNIAKSIEVQQLALADSHG